MALLDVVFRALNKAGTDFVEPRTENGHGSSLGTPSYVEVGNLPALQQVADDFATGEILADQVGANNVLTFEFASVVNNIWVYAVNASDLEALGEVRVEPFGGEPSAIYGIPVPFGGSFPIPVTGTTIKVFAPVDVRVTIYGNKRG